jgi:hypothetical protein
MQYNEGLAKLEGRAKLATIVLWLFVAVATLTAVGEVLQGLGMIDVEQGVGSLVLAIGFTYIAYTGLFLVSVVLVAMWIHRAHANLIEVGNEGLEFTPGWAVGWYFVPFANLVKPFQAMRELWTTSHAEHDSYGAEAPGEVKAWWGAWIVGNIVSSAGSRLQLMGQGEAGSTAVGSLVGAAGTVGIVIAAILLVKVIGGVTAAQRSGSSAVPVFA